VKCVVPDGGRSGTYATAVPATNNNNPATSAKVTRDVFMTPPFDLLVVTRGCYGGLPQFAYYCTYGKTVKGAHGLLGKDCRPVREGQMVVNFS
jgi:hypothetical protein